MKNHWKWLGIVAIFVCFNCRQKEGAGSSCENQGGGRPQATSGVQQITAKVTTNAEGITVEQQNIRDRLAADNKPGSIKHLYIISAYSGQVIIYSTVRGKVTSSAKRLSPTTVWMGTMRDNADVWGFRYNLGDKSYFTTEVLQDDGSYGTSSEYLYWWDTKGVYHQHYVAGGQIVHISDQPLSVPHIIINMETGESARPPSETSVEVPTP